VTGAAVIGVGLTPFGKHSDSSLGALTALAVSGALSDAGVQPEEIEMAFVANSMASVITGQVSVVGQSVLRPNGFSGIPVYNVDNACASSSSALDLAVQAIQAGRAEVVLVVGVEKLFGKERSDSYRALNGAVDTPFLEASGVDPGGESVFVASVYPERLGRYRDRFGLDAETLAEIAVKNRSNAFHNSLAQYTKPITAQDVLDSRVVIEPIHALMCAPISDGASAVVVASRRRAEAAGLRPVWISGIAVGMGGGSGAGTMVARLARKAYSEAWIEPRDIGVAEVHDSIAFNELLAYEELGFCGPGEGAGLVADAATTLTGRIPVNTSGGLESRGHPVAATGLAQVIEVVNQLRHDAGLRQVEDVRVGVTENAGGFAVDDTAAAVVTVLTSRLG
jgi:acetyl-CoA acyltransferase